MWPRADLHDAGNGARSASLKCACTVSEFLFPTVFFFGRLCCLVCQSHRPPDYRFPAVTTASGGPGLRGCYCAAANNPVIMLSPHCISHCPVCCLYLAFFSGIKIQAIHPPSRNAVRMRTNAGSARARVRRWLSPPIRPKKCLRQLRSLSIELEPTSAASRPRKAEHAAACIPALMAPGVIHLSGC